MAYRHMPDFIVPPSHLRCEAMTKQIIDTYQVWRQHPHRCIRRAMQGRDGRSVCALHSRMDLVNYWNGEPDPFPHKPFWKWRPRQLLKMIEREGVIA